MPWWAMLSQCILKRLLQTNFLPLEVWRRKRILGWIQIKVSWLNKEVGCPMHSFVDQQYCLGAATHNKKLGSCKSNKPESHCQHVSCLSIFLSLSFSFSVSLSLKNLPPPAALLCLASINCELGKALMKVFVISAGRMRWEPGSCWTGGEHNGIMGLQYSETKACQPTALRNFRILNRVKGELQDRQVLFKKKC